MSFIQNFYTSRDNNTDGNTYVGQEGRLWYNPLTNSIYVNTANVAGGTPVALATGADITANTITVNTINSINTITSSSGNISVTGNLIISGNISPASETRIGGVKAGPGANISLDGTLTIDTAGLPLSFGDFTANVNQLSMVNPDEDMYLVSNGTGNINLIGGVDFYKPNGFPPTAEPFFRATNDGQVRILVPTADINFGAVQIVGNDTGITLPPRLTGVMLHVTGNDGLISRIYNDASGNNAAYVGRRYNGTETSPTQVLANQSILRVTAVGHDDTEMPVDGTASIFFDALQNFTSTARGSQLKFQTTPLNGTTREFVATMDSQNGITATKGYFRYDIANSNATATQSTSKSTPVTANGRTGQITTHKESLAKGASVTFTVNNNFVTAVTDIPVVVIQSGATLNSYAIGVTRVQAGSFNITITNNGTGPLADVLLINFAIIKVS